MEPIQFLKLYVNPAWKGRGGIYSPLMFPFWGNPIKEVSLFAKEMFDAHPFDTRYYTVVEDISQADMVFPPYRYQWFLRSDNKLWEECVETAKEANLPLFVDAVGDIEYPIDIENAYILRIGGYRFLPQKNSIIIPPPTDDLLERVRGSKLEIRKKRDGKPVVGFAGWAALTPMQTLRTIVKESPARLHSIIDRRYSTFIKGVLWRKRAIDILRNSKDVELNLKARPTFSGSAKTASGDMRELREDLVTTILESDYALDVRGDANASTRLFEILSLGRIPVIVDTERNLPFRDVVDYKSFALIVDFRDIKKLPERIAEFHKNISAERYEEMQRKAREVFINYFRIDALMPHILKELNNLKNSQENRTDNSAIV